MEQTLCIIKPDAVSENKIGKVLSYIENAGLRVVAGTMKHLTKKEAEGFYAVHRQRPFFGELTDFISSGPVMILVLEGPDAIRRYRDVMGATDPSKAAPGTIRRDCAASIGCNAVHGSDSPETAAMEIPYFFSTCDLCPRP